MKLLIASGGGGHFAPALAVIEKLPRDWDVLVVGRKHTFEGDASLSLEYQTAQKLGIAFRPLVTGRLQRKLTRHTFSSLVKVPYGFFQALSILKEYKPDVVLSFGGYVSVPVALAAKVLGIPIVVHEQTLSAGLANKVVGKFADKICISWSESKKYFPAEKVVLTGNPIRNVIARSEDMSDEAIPNEIAALLTVARNDGGEKMIYITGGSGGAHAINVLVEGCLEKLLEKYVVIHQTGDAGEFRDFERLETLKDSFSPALQKRYIVTKFVEPSEVFGILQKADLVIARSGINTVTELLHFGKPCLLIPLPYGQRGEQLENALFVKKVGLAEVVEQEGLTSEKLYETIDRMFGGLDAYKQHAKTASQLVEIKAAEKIIEVVSQSSFPRTRESSR